MSFLLKEARRKELHLKRRPKKPRNQREISRLSKESHPEVLAHSIGRSWREIEPAIAALQKAGERAVAQRAGS